MSTPSKWRDLRRFTDARVALGRVGNALPTAAHLDFQEAHARARDAVWSSLDVAQLEVALGPLGLPIQHVTSQAEDRRRYLLRPDLLATRNIERLRNQLNSQQRWNSWISRPVQLYESRRPLFRLEAGAIDTITLTEPRDRELRQLPWLQQLVTLALEARDALAPQVQSLIRGFGDLVVVVLTQVVGRAIGLVGRGIAQGMGRSLGRAERS